MWSSVERRFRAVRRRRPIYVESRLRVPMDRVWEATQDPDRHQRWDVRFGEIAYQPKVDGAPQRFTYATTLLPGFRVAGTGESLGDRDRSDGTRWSGLKFWADDRRSIIEAGAGYWRYVPTEDGIRFLTRYDYRPRWGRVGELLDRTVVRPVFGWGTAWSFDRLRIWLEDGTSPEHQRNQALAHSVSVAGLAGVWIYQGLLPKLISVDPGETVLWMRALGVSERAARRAVRVAGIGEIIAGVVTLRFARSRPLFIGTAAAMPLLALGAAKADPRSFTRAFNPGSLNWAMAALALSAALTNDGIPSGRRPLRSAPDSQPEVGPLP
jgi:uncharacterized membrane protein